MGESMAAAALLDKASGNLTPQAPVPSVAAFREAMRRFAGTVSVVTSGLGPERTGFAATSVCSLAVEPPTLLVCLDRNASSWPVVRRHGAFCVNVLAEDQAAVAERFAGRSGLRGADRYRDAEWRTLETGALALGGALLSIDCVLEEAIERHSHAILIGHVVAVTGVSEARPLLYQHQAFRRLAP